MKKNTKNILTNKKIRVQIITRLRGGNWNNGSNAGVFALNLNNLRSNSNNNVGFRAALLLCQKFIPQEV